MKKNTICLILLSIISSLAYSQTTISGGIYSDSTFTLANSPYVVIGDIVLFPNKTLIIEAGVEIKFDGNFYFEVRGELIAIGNPTNRITFTSNAVNPEKNDWLGVNIKNSLGAKASFDYCNFSYAAISNQAECCFQGGPISYKNSKFENDSVAIGGYTGYEILILNCDFSKNTYAITDADKNIVNSSFIDNDYGLYRTERININFSTFTNNNVAIFGGLGLIENSSIQNNGTGVKILNQGIDMSNNVISNNEIGIQTSYYNGATQSIKNNQICNNTIYNVENLYSDNHDLTENCWCTSDQQEIEDKLYDGFDDITLGLFNYSIYDSTCTTINTSVINFNEMVSNIEDALVEISIYPNPVSTNLNIILKNQLDQASVKLFNINGKLIYSSSFYNTSDINISMEHLNSGIYFCIIKTQNYTIRKKVIKN